MDMEKAVKAKELETINPLIKARAVVEHDTERGLHKPAVAGFTDHNHSGKCCKE
jgi:hypothetical protein